MSAALQITERDSKIVIDAREVILSGGHPRHEIFAIVESSADAAIFEIHVPRKAIPLIKGLEQRGFDVDIDQQNETHYQLTVRKG